jgi:hypothetical protein
MEILEMTIKLKWNKPSNGQLPTQRQKCYIIDEYGDHRIMTYHPDGGWGQLNWEGESGASHSWKSNEQIKKWTTLLSDGSF